MPFLTALKKIPEVEHTYATIGAGDTGTVRDAMVYVKLADRKDAEALPEADPGRGPRRL